MERGDGEAQKARISFNICVSRAAVADEEEKQGHGSSGPFLTNWPKRSLNR